MTRPVQQIGPSIDAWEAAYLRFETPAEEIAKFTKRLRTLGAAAWPREAHVVELFCGRGNGLHALERLGFTNVEGVDLSANLVSKYAGPASTIVADCRTLPFDDASRDVLIVQGGLHHLPDLLPDLGRTLSEARRVLRPGGRFVAVEPWLTPFLRFVHRVCEANLARRLSPKVEALHTMIVHERETYERWLAHPREIRGLLDQHFQTQFRAETLGKLMYVGVRP